MLCVALVDARTALLYKIRNPRCAVSDRGVRSAGVDRKKARKYVGDNAIGEVCVEPSADRVVLGRRSFQCRQRGDSAASTAITGTTRYGLTDFAFGCGLGPAEAARHLDQSVSERILQFVNRRHVSTDDLRAACTDLIDLYARFDLPNSWGEGVAAGADGSLVEAYGDNLLTGYHARYRRTGGIAYRHVADNCIALFSQFVTVGVHESVHILEGILENRSRVRPTHLHADTHDQSECVFGLAHLLGIELMPRIRNWRTLRFSSDLVEQVRTCSNEVNTVFVDRLRQVCG